MAKGSPAGRCKEPRREGKRRVQRTNLADELEKGGLKSIFGGVRIEENTPTNPKNSSSMSADDPLERLRIASIAIPTEQFGII
jgi:hypothetical protein